MPSEPDLERDPLPHTRRASFDGPPPPKLVKFRFLTGIDTPKIIAGGHRSRPAKNLGIYSRVVAEETKTRWQYYFMASIINLSFLGQIVVAATLTALGAADASHIAITVLGSVNTVIAGVQTYLKGQGLPNRLRQYEFGLRKLREHIEDLERAFSHVDCRLNVDNEISDIAAMYKAVRQTAEDNTPDTYLPMTGAGKKLLEDKSSGVTGQDSSGFGTGLLMNGPSDIPAEAGLSKSAAIPDTTEQANSQKPPAEPETPEQLKGEPAESAGSDIQGPAAEPAASSTTPNEDGETEETPLLQHDDRAVASKD
ncbi:hypothetical protein N7G274_002610 [Stereocaulon virgatum]|uniref:SMODS and SLOG-associating 2TM effector domain-containing protein n=1 Tax=Stereocaulon virgatum TaxID=373712 RepID=A0ABR4AI35_9LECA